MYKERIHLTPLNLSADVSEGSSEPSKASPGKQTAHEQVRVRKDQGFKFGSSGSKNGLEPTLAYARLVCRCRARRAALRWVLRQQPRHRRRQVRMVGLGTRCGFLSVLFVGKRAFHFEQHVSKEYIEMACIFANLRHSSSFNLQVKRPWRSSPISLWTGAISETLPRPHKAAAGHLYNDRNSPQAVLSILRFEPGREILPAPFCPIEAAPFCWAPSLRAAPMR